MDRAATETVILGLLRRIERVLQQALPITTAAIACAEAGNSKKSIKLLMNIEPLAHDTLDLFRTTMALHRFRNDDGELIENDDDDV